MQEREKVHFRVNITYSNGGFECAIQNTNLIFREEIIIAGKIENHQKIQVSGPSGIICKFRLLTSMLNNQLLETL